MGLGDSEDDQKIGASLAQSGLDGNRIRDATVYVEAIVKANRMGIENRQSRARFECGQEINVLVMTAEDGLASGEGIGRDDSKQRWILAHTCEVESLAMRDDLVEEEIHVHDLAHAPWIDEAAIGDILVIDRGPEGGLSGQEVGAVDGSGRSAVDGIEGAGESELFQGNDSARTGDAAHGATLQDTGRLT